MGGSCSTTAADPVPAGFIGLGALFHSSHAAALLKGVEHYFSRQVFAFPVSFNYGCIQDTVTRHFVWGI